MPKTVIFVSDSALDVYNDRALLGTTAYRVFLEYLYTLDLHVRDVLLYNEKDSRTIEAIAVNDGGVRVVTLGKVAEEVMKELNVPYFSLPDLSAKMQDLQSFDFKVMLNNCKDYVHDCKGQ